MPALVALPDIAIALAGILLLVLAYAIWTLRDFLVAGFSHVPVVGGWIAGRLGSVLDSAATAVTHASAAAFGGAEHFLRACLTWCQSVTGWATHIYLDIVNTVIHIAEVQVPRIYSLALRDTAGALATARHYIAAALATAEHDIVHVQQAAAHDTAVALGTAERDVAHALSAADSAVASALRTAEADITRVQLAAARDIGSAYDRAVAYADTAAAGVRAEALAWFRQAETTALGEVAVAETMASTALNAAVGGLVTDLDTWGNKAVSVAWPDASGSIDALRKALGQNFPDLLKLLPLLGGAGAAGLVGALIRAIGGVHVLTNVMTDCVVPNCDNLGQLGKELKQLSSLGAAAAVLAWLAYIAADPVAAADETVTVASPLTDAVFGPLVDLISAGAQHL